MSSRRETLWAVCQNLEPEDRENRQNHEFVQAEETGFFVCLFVYFTKLHRTPVCYIPAILYQDSDETRDDLTLQ